MDNLSSPHGGNIWRAQELCKREIIDFSANINPLGIAPRVKESISNKIENILHYPDPQARRATLALAHYWNISPDSILLGNGAVELIHLIAQVFHLKRVLIPSPTFSEYEQAVKKTGTQLYFPRLKNGFKLDLDSLDAKEEEILFLCNPNNPTGNLLFETTEEISAMKSLVIIDEAFMDFLPDEENYTLLWQATKRKNIIVLRTLTKFFALPGLRIGYLIATPEIVEELRRLQFPWSVNVLAQVAAEKSLNKEYIRETRELIARERDFLFNELSNIKVLKPYPTVTNFILVKIEEKISSTNLQHKLLKKGILIRDCSNFRYLDNRFIRVAIRTHEENILLLKNLKEIL